MAIGAAVERTSSRAGVAPAEVRQPFTAHYFNSEEFTPEKSFSLKPSLISATSQQARRKSDVAQSDDTSIILESWYKATALTASNSKKHPSGSIHELRKAAGTNIIQKP